MKACAIQTLLAAGLLAAAAAGCASAPAAPQAARSKPVLASPKAEELELTGSYLKQRVTRSGLITDSAGNVVVIDQDMIRRSGAGDVREVLVKTGQKR
ncbi:MAG: hypothetical protein N3I86_01600 [Verrucomicrobiae bacterium]|nr:hypothetical protein [Verrucomicrobiae bacterium]MDW8309166.1 hypothetical protein [Verrucomicrobiales bacterium]